MKYLNGITKGTEAGRSTPVTRMLLIAAALLLAAVPLFANGSSEQSSSGSSSKPAMSNTSSSGGSSQLTFWNMPFVTQEVSPSYVQQWQKNAKSALPNHSVSDFYGPGKYDAMRQKFLVQASSGSPSVIEGLLEDVAVYEKKGLIEPLDSYFNNWDKSSEFVKATLKPLTIGGKLWGIPYNTNARGLIYRTDVFKKYGLSVPRTWSDLISTARTITEKSNGKMHGLYLCTKVNGPRGAQEFISWYFQVSGGHHMFSVDNSGNVTYNATVPELEKIMNLYKEAFSGPNPAADPSQKGNGWESEDPGYVSGKWAMAPEGPWLWGRRQGDKTAADILDNSKVVALPVAPGGVPATYLEVKEIMMNKYAKDKKGAWDLIKFITSKEQMAKWLASSGGIPPRKDSQNLAIFNGKIGNWNSMFAALLPQAVAQAPVNWGPVSEANLRAVNYVIYGQKSPHDAAVWLHDQVQQMVNNGKL